MQYTLHKFVNVMRRTLSIVPLPAKLSQGRISSIVHSYFTPVCGIVKTTVYGTDGSIV